MSSTKMDGASLIAPGSIASRALSGARSAPESGELETAILELSLILSSATNQFALGVSAPAVIDQTVARLRALRHKSHPAVWNSVVDIAQRHRVATYFLQDPITRHSFEKPRGYSGDAELLDYIYGHASTQADVDSASALGLKLYGYTSKSAAAIALRERRDLLAKEVDGIAAARPDEAEILTVAAGHLREADLSVALQNGQIKRWVALDQDPLSVGLIARDLAGTVVDAIDGSVRGILRNDYSLGQFDLVYAAGLYDYLPRAVAVKLTKKCMSMLKPGGSYLFANFADDIWDVGYMETFMNWALLLRSEDDMWDIANASVDRNVVDVEVFYGENRNIVYARLTRKT